MECRAQAGLAGPEDRYKTRPSFIGIPWTAQRVVVGSYTSPSGLAYSQVKRKERWGVTASRVPLIESAARRTPTRFAQIEARHALSLSPRADRSPLSALTLFVACATADCALWRLSSIAARTMAFISAKVLATRAHNPGAYKLVVRAPRPASALPCPTSPAP
jgi:hypothetical protein